MIARQPTCDLQRLDALLLEQLDDVQQSQLLRHLDQCVHCQQQLEHLTANDTWWDDTRLTLLDLQSESIAIANLAASGKSQTLPPFHGMLRAGASSGVLSTAVRANELAAGSLAAEPSDIDLHPHWVLGLLQPSNDASLLGEIDGLAVQAVIGQGGMGVVLKARDPSLQRFLAIKLLSPMLAGSGAARQRFFREARAAAAVVHPNIVPIYAVSAERSLPYLVMPLVTGGNLQQAIDLEGPLPLERSLSIGLQVAEGLAAAHRQGIVHRDIKPANLLLDEGGFRILISDFGLARALDDATLTGSGMLAGTPQYMSPEQARGAELDHRTDIYSLGAVLYAMATGRPPVRGESTLETLRRISEERPRSILDINSAYPAWYERLVQALMAPKSVDRPQSAEQVAGLVRGALAHARDPHHVALPALLRRTAWSRPAKLAAVFAMLCIGVVFSASAWLAVSTYFQGDLAPQVTTTNEGPIAPRTATANLAAGSTDEVDQPAELETLPAVNEIGIEDWSSNMVEQRLDTSQQALRQLRSELEGGT